MGDKSGFPAGYLILPGSVCPNFLPPLGLEQPVPCLIEFLNPYHIDGGKYA